VTTAVHDAGSLTSRWLKYAASPQLLGQCLAAVIGHIGDDDAGAFAYECARDGRALALGAAGDDGALVRETRHVFLREYGVGVG